MEELDEMEILTGYGELHDEHTSWLYINCDKALDYRTKRVTKFVTFYHLSGIRVDLSDLEHFNWIFEIIVLVR